jgi:hypothetical protein
MIKKTINFRANTNYRYNTTDTTQQIQHNRYNHPLQVIKQQHMTQAPKQQPPRNKQQAPRNKHNKRQVFSSYDPLAHRLSFGTYEDCDMGAKRSVVTTAGTNGYFVLK